MPYIKPEDRISLDPIIKQAVVELSKEESNEGKLNYFISKLLWEIFKREKRYKTINKLMGVLECVKAEFYAKQARPYEEEAEKKNGPII